MPLNGMGGRNNPCSDGSKILCNASALRRQCFHLEQLGDDLLSVWSITSWHDVLLLNVKRHASG